MVWGYEPIVEKIEQGLEFFASDVRDGNCGFIGCPFLGFFLPFVDGLWDGKHIFEEPGL